MRFTARFSVLLRGHKLARKIRSRRKRRSILVFYGLRPIYDSRTKHASVVKYTLEPQKSKIGCIPLRLKLFYLKKISSRTELAIGSHSKARKKEGKQGKHRCVDGARSMEQPQASEYKLILADDVSARDLRDRESTKNHSGKYLIYLKYF